MTAMCRFVVLLLGLSACATQEETSARSDAPETASQSTESTAAPTLDLVLSEAGLGPARICAPLAEAAAALGPARDSAFLGEAEDDRWPGKIVRLSDGQNVLLEASWADSAHVWRISTTSPGADAGRRSGRDDRCQHPCRQRPAQSGAPGGAPGCRAHGGQRRSHPRQCERTRVYAAVDSRWRLA